MTDPGRVLRVIGSREELAELAELRDHSHDTLLTVPQAAERLNISSTTAYYLAARGELPVVRFPGSRIVRVSSRGLEAFVRRQVERWEAEKRRGEAGP